MNTTKQTSVKPKLPACFSNASHLVVVDVGRLVLVRHLGVVVRRRARQLLRLQHQRATTQGRERADRPDRDRSKRSSSLKPTQWQPLSPKTPKQQLPFVWSRGSQNCPFSPFCFEHTKAFPIRTPDQLFVCNKQFLQFYLQQDFPFQFLR